MIDAPFALRSRLLVVILLPLIAVAGLLALLRFNDAARTASELFDRTLLASAFAIARDVAASDGDTLEMTDWDILNDVSGGQVFYHAGGADGSFVIGYATPPVPPAGLEWNQEAPLFYNSTHLGIPVRAVRLRAFVGSAEVAGYSIVTAWQRLDARQNFARDLGLRTLGILSVLITSVAAIVWFGVNWGLRPLTDLEEAISRRSGDDLQDIRRAVPPEIRGLVERLNRLFGQVQRELASKDAFISDAAHQLRNPVAGVLALAEAAQSARTQADVDERLGDLVDAARHTSRLANQMLTYERASGQDLTDEMPVLDLASLTRTVCERLETPDRALPVEGADVFVRGDAALLGEAITNIVDNALVHGDGGAITIRVYIRGDEAVVAVHNTGKPLPPAQLARAMDRFAQLEEVPGTNPGTGLGLAIVKTIAERHDGDLRAVDRRDGAEVEFILPRATRT